MYKYFILVFVFLFFGCTSEPTVDNKLTDIEDLQKSAMKQHMESPVLALPMMIELAEKYTQKSSFLEASETYLNVATIYDETLNDKKKALVYGQKSLVTAEQSKNEIQQVTALRYIGYAKGLTGDMKGGKKDLVDAMLKSKSLNDDAGEAEASFNLSRVFYMEGALEESAHFLAKSMTPLRAIKNSEQIFYNNLFAISLFRKMNQQEMVQAAIDENKSLMASIKYDGYIKQEFERLLKGDE